MMVHIINILIPSLLLKIMSLCIPYIVIQFYTDIRDKKE
jgi:hypothetical protein